VGAGGEVGNACPHGRDPPCCRSQGGAGMPSQHPRFCTRRNACRKECSDRSQSTSRTWCSAARACSPSMAAAQMAGRPCHSGAAPWRNLGPRASNASSASCCSSTSSSKPALLLLLMAAASRLMAAAYVTCSGLAMMVLSAATTVGRVLSLLLRIGAHGPDQPHAFATRQAPPAARRGTAGSGCMLSTILNGYARPETAGSVDTRDGR